MQDDYDEMRARYHGYSLDDPAPDPDAKRETDIQAAWETYEAARRAKRREAEWPEIVGPKFITEQVRLPNLDEFKK